jgi:hypothetical protein
MIHIAEVRTYQPLSVDDAGSGSYTDPSRGSGYVRDQRWVLDEPVSLSEGDAVAIDQESSEVVVHRHGGGEDHYHASVRPAGLIDELMTLADVCRQFGFKESYVRWLRQEGKIPCGKIHGQLRFVRSHLEEWAWNHLAQDPSMGDADGD